MIAYGFAKQMKLEARDDVNDYMCCATVLEVRGAQLRIHFDGWSSDYDFWTHPYSGLVHPVNWCSENGVRLLPPPKHACRYHRRPNTPVGATAAQTRL